MNNTALEFISLLGKSLEEVTSIIQGYGYPYRVITTREPRHRETETEKLVVRVKKIEEEIEIVIGYFQVPKGSSSTRQPPY